MESACSAGVNLRLGTQVRHEAWCLLQLVDTGITRIAFACCRNIVDCMQHQPARPRLQRQLGPVSSQLWLSTFVVRAALRLLQMAYGEVWRPQWCDADSLQLAAGRAALPPQRTNAEALQDATSAFSGGFDGGAFGVAGSFVTAAAVINATALSADFAYMPALRGNGNGSLLGAYRNPLMPSQQLCFSVRQPVVACCVGLHFSMHHA